jgi:hypothetical protein
MKRYLRRRPLQLGVIAIAVLALGSGIAYAAIPGSGGVYTACMLKHVGTLRLIDTSLPSSNPMSHCSTTFETQVSWNQTGQQGQQGPQGPKGDIGPQGPAGADGLSHADYDANTLTVNDGFKQRVVGLSGLPAGTYLVWATVRSVSGSDTAFCQLDNNSSALDNSSAPISSADSASRIEESKATSFTGVVTIAGADVVGVNCISEAGAVTQNESTIAAAITAVKLDSLN